MGAPTGLLDQLAALFGEARQAMLIDFRDVSVRPVPFDPDAADVALLLINSRATHQHAGGEYADTARLLRAGRRRSPGVLAAGRAGSADRRHSKR